MWYERQLWGESVRAWGVAVACFWLSFLTVGLHRSAGVLYVAVVRHFQVTREFASWPFSLCGALMCLLGPVAGFLNHYFSIRSLIVTGILVSAISIALGFFTSSLIYLIIFFGFFRGIGNGLVVTLNPVLIHRHFGRRQATATGLAYAGASVGSFALPPLLEHLLNTYSLRGALLLLGALVLNGLLPAMVARAPPKPKPKVTRPEDGCPAVQPLMDVAVISLPPTSAPVTLLQKVSRLSQVRATAHILSHPAHLAACITFGATVVNFIAFLTVLVDFGRDRGLAEGEAALLVSFFSVGDLLGAVALGPLADRVGHRCLCVAVAFSGLSALLFGLPWMGSTMALRGTSAGVGLCTGVLMANVPVVMRARLGVERLAVAVGLGHFFVGVGQLVFPMLIGYFRDSVGSYDHLFSTLGGMCAVCALLWYIEPLLVKMKPIED